jgi:N-methylhydantoinase B/oxoprolinase/acetone carboxylase alpha subunit
MESYGGGQDINEPCYAFTNAALPEPQCHSQIYSAGQWHECPIYQLEDLSPGHEVQGPAIIIEPNGTVIVEARWRAKMTRHKHLLLEKSLAAKPDNNAVPEGDPVMVEIFNNQFMSIAEQMGIVLRNTSSSVNIKERLDFSCAVFDLSGKLIANAPHISVHLGSMEAAANALFGALGVLGMSQGTMNNLTFGNEEYQYYETICSGAPAGPGFDGNAAVHTHMTNSRLTDPEVLESRFPVVLDKFVIRRGSGGKGRWQAGDGVERRIRFLADMHCAILSGHREVPLAGTNGGQAGEIGHNWIDIPGQGALQLGACGEAEVQAGHTVVIQTPTGGGFGPSKKEHFFKNEE